LVALEAAGFHRVAHRLLDFALRGDADLLEKLAQAGVENVFVHNDLLIALDHTLITALHEPPSFEARKRSHLQRQRQSRCAGMTHVTGGPDGSACIRRDRADGGRCARWRCYVERHDPSDKRHIAAIPPRHCWRGRTRRRRRWSRPWWAVPARGNLRAKARRATERCGAVRSYVAFTNSIRILVLSLR